MSFSVLKIDKITHPTRRRFLEMSSWWVISRFSQWINWVLWSSKEYIFEDLFEKFQEPGDFFWDSIVGNMQRVLQSKDVRDRVNAKMTSLYPWKIFPEITEDIVVDERSINDWCMKMFRFQEGLFIDDYEQTFKRLPLYIRENLTLGNCDIDLNIESLDEIICDIRDGKEWEVNNDFFSLRVASHIDIGDENSLDLDIRIHRWRGTFLGTIFQKDWETLYCDGSFYEEDLDVMLEMLQSPKKLLEIVYKRHLKYKNWLNDETRWSMEKSLDKQKQDSINKSVSKFKNWLLSTTLPVDYYIWEVKNRIDNLFKARI